MDGVEDEGEDQGQEEGRPASQEKVGDGGERNNLVPDLYYIFVSRNGQDSQAGKNYQTRQLINK